MRNFVFCVVLSLLTAIAAAQSTTANLSVRAHTASGAISGVLVTVSSPALQQTRSAETSSDGTAVFPALPPGTYRVTFAMSGMQTVVKSIDLHLGDVREVTAELRQTLAEEITVDAQQPAGMETPQISTTFSQDLVNALPIGRGLLDAALLAPGVHDSGLERRLTIHGAPANENLYLVDGAVITEGLRNQPQNLFIEDAIQETTILGGAVSAEYGRFTGGVVSAITRGGGNTFDGTLRDNLTSDRWTATTPFPGEIEHLDQIDHRFEATAGGRLVRDRLWFFMAGRSAGRREQQQTETGIGYPYRKDERRLEGKLTANVLANHTLVGSYLDVDADETNSTHGAIGDLRSLSNTKEPFSLLAAHYTGVLSHAGVLEAQYTRKQYNVTAGGSDRSFEQGSLVFGEVEPYSLWAPVLCASCGPVYRNNHELLGKASLFYASPHLGTHELVAGVSDFHELAADNGHQSPSDFTLFGSLIASGTQRFVSVIPGESEIEWDPVLVPSRGDDYGTRAAFVNDRINVGGRLTFNAGIRYERAHGRDQGGTAQAEGTSWSPRLGAMFDVRGDGRDRVALSFSRYAAKIDEYVARLASPAGLATTFIWSYDGPPINTGSGPYLPTDEVLRRVQAWLTSIGAPGNRDDVIFVSSAAGRVVERPLHAPVMEEVTAGYGRQFGSGGSARIDLIHRRWHELYSLRTEAGESIVDPAAGNLDRVVVENNDDGLQRYYDGVALQGAWRRRNAFIGGNLTLSRLRGNVESESGSGTTAVPGPGRYYTEYTNHANFAPIGYLNADERTRGQVWAGYDFRTPLAEVQASVLQTYHTGRPYTAVGSIDVRSFVKNPGYRSPPTLQNYFFSGRGQYRTDTITATGVALNLTRAFGAVRAFIDTGVTNVFNESAIESPSSVSLNTRVRTNRSDRNLALFNPFTTAAPVECPRGTPTSSATCKGVANFQLDPAFGTATGRDAYQEPRTFRISFGLRF